MNLGEHIQPHMDNHVQRFRHLDAPAKKIIKELALPHIELHHLYANHPQDISFEPAEPIIDLLRRLGMEETLAPLPTKIKEDAALKELGVDMDEISAREDSELADVPLHLYFNDEQLAAMSEEKKRAARVYYYDNHWRNKISSKVDRNLRTIGSNLIEEPQVRFAAELNVFKRKLKEFVQLQHGKVQKLFDEGAITATIQNALLKTITVQNIVQDSLVLEKRKQFGAAEPKLGRLEDEDEGVFVVPNFTAEQTSTALNTIATTMMQTTGVALDVANARAREMLRVTLNVGSLAHTFITLGGTAAIGSFAGLWLCNSMKTTVDAFYYTLIGTSAGAGLSIGVLASLHKLCTVEPPNFGGATAFIEEGLNQMSEFMGTLDEYDIAQEEKESDLRIDMVEAIGEEHEDAEQASRMTEDQLVGAKAWVDDYIAQYESIENIDDMSSPDYAFQVRVGDKLLSLGTARARRDELFYKIGAIRGMKAHTFVSVNREVKEYYVYQPFQGTRCIFTRLTMGKLISFVESLDSDQKDIVFREFHHTIPLNFKMGERLSNLVSPEENAFMKREDRGVYYPANCVFNIIEQAESVEMLKGHKENRDFESLLKKPEGSWIFRLFSGLVYYLKRTFGAGIWVVKKICETIWNGLKTATGFVGRIVTSIVRYLTNDAVADMVDYIFSSVGAGVEYLLYNSYRHVLNVVDWVASNQTRLLIANTVCCIAAQTVVLTGAGFLFPGVAGATSSYVLWKGVKLASQMMGMQIADAVLTLLGSTGRLFSRLLQNTSWLGSFITKAVPDAMAPWIKGMIDISTNAKTMIAPLSSAALNQSQVKAASGAMIVFASGVAYFAALPFAIPIGVAGGLLSISGMFGSQMSATMHAQEAFQASASWFHMTARNMLYALITSPYKGFASLFTSGASITYMQLQQPIWYIDILCQILSSGFLGRNCRKVQKMFIKFWRRSFAARFIYGMMMDIVVLSGIDPMGIGNVAWSQGNCSGHLARIPINDYKKVNIYKWRTKNNQMIEFVVDAETLEETPRLRPKIVRVIVDNVAHDVTSEVRSIKDNRWSTYWGLTNNKDDTKWIIKAKERFEYDADKNIVLTKADENIFGPDAESIGEELEKLLQVYRDSSFQPKQGQIETREDTIVMRDIEIQAELAQLTTLQDENYIILDENGVTIAICKDGELRTAPISSFDTTKTVSKEQLESLKSWKLDKNAFSNGILKIEMQDVDGYTFATGYRTFTENESTRIFTDLSGDSSKDEFAVFSDKKGEAFTLDIRDTNDLVFKEGLNMTSEKYRVLHVPEGNLLLDGRQLQWRTHELRPNTSKHLVRQEQKDAMQFVEKSMPENLETLGKKLKETYKNQYREQQEVQEKKLQLDREIRQKAQADYRQAEEQRKMEMVRKAVENNKRQETTLPALNQTDKFQQAAQENITSAELPERLQPDPELDPRVQDARRAEPMPGPASVDEPVEPTGLAQTIGLLATSVWKRSTAPFIKHAKDKEARLAKLREPKEVFVCDADGKCAYKILDKKAGMYGSGTSGPAPPGYGVPLDRNKRDGPMTEVPKAIAPPPAATPSKARENTFLKF